MVIEIVLNISLIISGRVNTAKENVSSFNFSISSVGNLVSLFAALMVF